MKHTFTLSLFAAVFALAGTVAMGADDPTVEKVEKKVVIALKTDDFEMAETDISDLEVGESETIVTQSGKTIDLLRTAEGVEVYIDGELLDMGNGDMDGAHGDHPARHKRVEVICENDGECEKTVWVGDGETGGHEMIRRVEIECESEGDCQEHDVWISDGEELDIEAMHEPGGEHGTMIVKKRIGAHDIESLSEEEIEMLEAGDGEKVLVIKKKVRKE